MNQWIKRLTGAAMAGAFVALFMTMGFALEGGLDRYDEYYALCTDRDGTARAALRSFHREGRRQLLTVDPVDLRTYIVPSTGLSCRELPFSGLRKELKGSPYAAAMADAEKNSRAVQNAGFSRYIPNQKGVNLTADLCPSKAPLDRRLFLALIKSFKDIQSPVPIALAVTGLWLETHGDDVRWLRQLERDGKIVILWINHSYHHRVKRRTPLKKNFLLSPGTVLDREILGTEKKMLEMGLLPSVFFRFPGLVSNHGLFHKITGYGLIPVGSDAWLGKKQWPRDGSIVLLHANGREPVGIKRFLRLLEARKKQILRRHWVLYDLRESVAAYESARLQPVSRNAGRPPVPKGNGKGKGRPAAI